MQKLPIDLLRHSDFICYVEEGYGGKRIEEWPVFKFYKLYVLGRKKIAKDQYQEWYKEQLFKYSGIESKYGGMMNGSLYKLIEKKSNKKFEECSDSEIKQIITERVRQRFSLLESIDKNGYQISKAEKIFAVKKGQFYYLKGGHHRAAALLALGINEMPGIVVFPNQLVYNVFSLMRKIKKYAKI